MEATSSAVPAMPMVRIMREVFSRIWGQCEMTAAAMTSRSAATKIESRITAIRRSPRRAVTGPDVEEAAMDRCGPLRERERGAAPRKLLSIAGSFLLQTKHSALSSSFLTPQKGQYIRKDDYYAALPYEMCEQAHIQPRIRAMKTIASGIVYSSSGSSSSSHSRSHDASRRCWSEASLKLRSQTSPR